MAPHLGYHFFREHPQLNHRAFDWKFPSVGMLILVETNHIILPEDIPEEYSEAIARATAARWVLHSDAEVHCVSSSAQGSPGHGDSHKHTLL
jgi:hypothetical protein